MLQHVRRQYLLSAYFVEHIPEGWVYCLAGQDKERGAWSRAYSSITSAMLVIAWQLRREVARRDARYRPEWTNCPASRGAFPLPKRNENGGVRTAEE